MRNKIIVIGIGRLGALIATKASEKGLDVIAIDKDPDAFDRLPQTFSGYSLNGDAININFLERSGVKNAKELILATGDDNLNIFLAHAAYFKYQVPKITIRLDDYEKAVLVDKLNIKIIAPTKLSFSAYQHKEVKDSK